MNFNSNNEAMKTTNFIKISVFSIFSVVLLYLSVSVCAESGGRGSACVVAASSLVWCVVALILGAHLQNVHYERKYQEHFGSPRVYLPRTKERAAYLAEMERDCAARQHKSKYGSLEYICRECTYQQHNKEGETIGELVARYEVSGAKGAWHGVRYEHWKRPLEYFGLYDENELASDLFKRLANLWESGEIRKYECNAKGL